MELTDLRRSQFSILHLNPHHPPSFPPPLLAHLTGTELPPPPPSSIIGHTPVANASQAELLRLQMAQDRLAPLMAQGEDDENGDRLGLAGLKVGRERHREDAAAENTLLAQEKAAKVDGDEEEDWEVLAGEAAKLLVLPVSCARWLLFTLAGVLVDPFSTGLATTQVDSRLPAGRVQLLLLLRCVIYPLISGL